MVHQIKKFSVNKKRNSNFYIFLFILLVYFDSFDVNNDHIITRDDLEICLPATVESQQLIQQLLRQWDVVNIFN